MTDAPLQEAEPGLDRRARLAWGLLALAGVLFVAYAALRVTERGRFALPYSTYGAGPEGTRGVFELLASEGIPVRQWTEDTGRLPPGGALIILGGCDHPGSRSMSRPERERLTEWVEAGGVLVVAGAADFIGPELGATLRMRSFEECFGNAGVVSLLREAEEGDEEDPGTDPNEVLPPPVAPPGATPGPQDKPPVEEGFDDPNGMLEALDDGIELAEPVWGVPALPPLVGLPQLGMRNAGAIDLEAGAEARVLASTGGKIGIVEIRRGEGYVVALASASLFQNRDLLDHGGAALTMRLVRYYAPLGPIYFDEYHVGAGERRSMIRYLSQLGAVPLMLQLLFAFGLFYWARARRFGGMRDTMVLPPSSTRDYVGGLAGLFRAAKDRTGTLGILVRAALRQIAAAHRRDETDPVALANALEARGSVGAAREVRAIIAIGARIAPGELAKASRDLDDAVRRAIHPE